MVAKTLWGSLHAYPDLLTTLSFLTCSVRSPGQEDYLKLILILVYINATSNLSLVLSASFVITRAAMTIGRESVKSVACMQKLNTTSSIETELLAHES
jgi:hypothetical protein